MSLNRTIGWYYFDEPTVNGASYLHLSRDYFFPMVQALPTESFFQQARSLPHYSLKFKRHEMKC